MKCSVNHNCIAISGNARVIAISGSVMITAKERLKKQLRAAMATFINIIIDLCFAVVLLLLKEQINQKIYS